MSIGERLDMEHEDHRHESNLACLGGRRKFQFCHRCGSIDGMQITHRETLEEMKTSEIAALSWYLASRESYYLFYVCPRCNKDKIIPGGYNPMTLPDVLAWLSRDPIAPDYAALAAEEPVSQIENARESAGLEE